MPASEAQPSLQRVDKNTSRSWVAMKAWKLRWVKHYRVITLWPWGNVYQREWTHPFYLLIGSVVSIPALIGYLFCPPSLFPHPLRRASSPVAPSPVAPVYPDLSPRRTYQFSFQIFGILHLQSAETRVCSHLIVSVCPRLGFGLPPRCPQVVRCHWGEVKLPRWLRTGWRSVTGRQGKIFESLHRGWELNPGNGEGGRQWD